MATLAATLGAADAHLLSGARLFREGRFEQAYVEFRVAERLGAGGEAAWYAAASLEKLDRHEEALEAFAKAAQAAPAANDALLDYYRALACYGARLYLCADRLLASVGSRSGPKVSGQAAAIRKDLAKLFALEPGATAIDWYLDRGAAALEGGRAELAAELFGEAEALGGLRKDRHRLAEAQRRKSEARERATARAR